MATTPKRTLKTPGVPDPTVLTEGEQLVPVTDTPVETIETEEQPVLDTAQKLADTQEQLAVAISELSSFKNDPDAMQERIAELKPELANPNLASEMAKRPDRTKISSGKLTENGWLV